VFLLVENYQLTAFVGLLIGKEFLETYYVNHFFIEGILFIDLSTLVVGV